MHRDLKPENILMVDRHSLKIKLTDFGLAKVVSRADFLTTYCGTPNYGKHLLSVFLIYTTIVAPEVLSPSAERAYNKAVDLWSAGVVLYICLCGGPPFSDALAPPSLKEQILKGLYHFPSPDWDDISDEAVDLVVWLLTVDVNQRATVQDALEHPFMELRDEELAEDSVIEVLDALDSAVPRLERMTTEELVNSQKEVSPMKRRGRNAGSQVEQNAWQEKQRLSQSLGMYIRRQGSAVGGYSQGRGEHTLRTTTQWFTANSGEEAADIDGKVTLKTGVTVQMQHVHLDDTKEEEMPVGAKKRSAPLSFESPTIEYVNGSAFDHLPTRGDMGKRRK